MVRVIGLVVMLCHRCKKRPGKVFNRGPMVRTDQVNEWLGRPLFPRGKMVCRKCIRKVAGEERLHRLIEYVAYWSHG